MLVLIDDLQPGRCALDALLGTGTIRRLPCQVRHHRLEPSISVPQTGVAGQQDILPCTPASSPPQLLVGLRSAHNAAFVPAYAMRPVARLTVETGCRQSANREHQTS